MFGFLRRRRDRESALPAAGSASGLDATHAPPPASGPLGEAPPGTIGMQSAQTIDARNVAGLRDNMLEILKRHGIDPMSGQTAAINAAEIPGLTEEIQGALAGHGIQIPTVAWSPQGMPGLMQMGEPPHGSDPARRIHKLEQLRDSGLISPAEFDQQRSRILGEL